MTEIIDTCIHHRCADQTELMEYLSADWRGYVGSPDTLPAGAGARPIAVQQRYTNPSGSYMESACDGDTPPGSSYELLDAHVLRRHGVSKAILLYDYEMMFGAGLPNQHLASAVVRAANDWTVDRWLSRDARLYAALLVNTQLPEEAAAEIRRLGSHPQVAAVVLAANSLGKTFGHPIYAPIYDAAVEFDLTVIIHRGGEILPDAAGPAGGQPGTFAEYSAISAVPLFSHVTSLVNQGTLARLPALRVMIAGGGVAWVPGLIYRLELAWKALRVEVPWIREAPEETFLRQIRVCTYGLERSERPQPLKSIIAAYPAFERIVCYGSGYPSWDAADPAAVEDLFPPAWSERVFHDNARTWFRWGIDAAKDASPEAPSTAGFTDGVA